MTTSILAKSALFDTLPPERQTPVLAEIQQLTKAKIDVIIVLDDDPTGTQTVYDVPVLTNWEVESIIQEFISGSPIFYILTNSRSLTEQEASQLAVEIGQNIRKAAEQTQTRFWVISRSDSTLRGHYPIEVDALEKGLGWGQHTQFIIPAFFEGGRFTINDIHYVQQAEKLIPASHTPYAKDKVFGFKHSNLKDWIVEKTNGSVAIDNIETIDLTVLRTNTLSSLVENLNQLKKEAVCIINAATYSDLYFFAKAILKSDIKPIFRTAASFVRAIAGLAEKPLLDGTSIRRNNQNGGLVVVGSYVPTSSLQLKHLLTNRKEIIPIEIAVKKLLSTNNKAQLREEIEQIINRALQNGQTVVLFTSRELITAATDEENQQIGKTISQFLTQIVANLHVFPAYLLTKGGITSSDIATKSIGIKRAVVKGQIIKGVPVWELGKETKFPRSHQIIFPGNVGTESSLTEVVDKLTKRD
ncbi:MAG: four-carbon acid sugar kinase family protein [Saprospiraceae bacterium]